MLLDCGIDPGHEADGFGQGDDDFLVMGDVILRERAAFAVFEPFLADLVAADVEVPDGFRHAAKAGALRFVDPDGVAQCPLFMAVAGRAASAMPPARLTLVELVIVPKAGIHLICNRSNVICGLGCLDFLTNI